MIPNCTIRQKGLIKCCRTEKRGGREYRKGGNLNSDITDAGRKIGGGGGGAHNYKRGITYDTTVTVYKNGGEDRRARSKKRQGSN